MQIISSKSGVYTIECCAIFRHYIGWGNEVICPYCGETKAMDTLQQEAERRREGENLVLAGT